MIHDFDATAASLAAAMLLAGGAFGFAYFAALQQTVARFAIHPNWARAGALTMGRLAAAVIFFAAAARLGAVPLAAAFLGFLGARAHRLRAVRRAD